MKKLKFIFALAAAFIFGGCYETTLLTRVPISALVSDKGADVKSTIVLTGITPQTHETKTVTDNVRVFVPDAKFKDFPTRETAYEMSVSVGKGEKDGKNSDKQTKKGVFITTSKFSKDAERYAANVQSHTVVLIDGERLAELMIKYKLGVQVRQNIEICDTRGDFFGDEI